MAKNVTYTTLWMKSLLRLYNQQFNSRGLVRSYHPEMGKFPGIPLPIHDSEYHMFPEGGQPLNLFVPDLSEIDYDDIKEEVRLRVTNSIANGQKILQRTYEIDLILISNQALQTAKEVPNKIMKHNYFVSSEGFIAVEKMFPLEKVMTTFKDKLSNVTSKIMEGREIPPQAIKIWENFKEKLPVWQNNIASKLQEFQNRINKGTAKKEEGL